MATKVTVVGEKQYITHLHGSARVL